MRCDSGCQGLRPCPPRRRLLPLPPAGRKTWLAISTASMPLSLTMLTAPCWPPVTMATIVPKSAEVSKSAEMSARVASSSSSGASPAYRRRQGHAEATGGQYVLLHACNFCHVSSPDKVDLSMGVRWTWLRRRCRPRPPPALVQASRPSMPPTRRAAKQFAAACRMSACRMTSLLDLGCHTPCMRSPAAIQ